MVCVDYEPLSVLNSTVFSSAVEVKEELEEDVKMEMDVADDKMVGEEQESSRNTDDDIDEKMVGEEQESSLDADNSIDEKMVGEQQESSLEADDDIDEKMVGEDQESPVAAGGGIISTSVEEGSEDEQNIGKYNAFFHTRSMSFISRMLGFFLFGMCRLWTLISFKWHCFFFCSWS